MATYLVDPAVLGQIVDGIISEVYPNSANITADFKEKAMLALDNQILRDILSSLTKEQGGELNSLLDKDDSDPEALEKFFEKHHIDLEKILKGSMAEFKNHLERSKNAWTRIF